MIRKKPKSSGYNLKFSKKLATLGWGAGSLDSPGTSQHFRSYNKWWINLQKVKRSENSLVSFFVRINSLRCICHSFRNIIHNKSQYFVDKVIIQKRDKALKAIDGLYADMKKPIGTIYTPCSVLALMIDQCKKNGFGYNIDQYTRYCMQTAKVHMSICVISSPYSRATLCSGQEEDQKQMKQ